MRREALSQGQGATSHLVRTGNGALGWKPPHTRTLVTEALSLPQDVKPLLQLQVWLLRSYGFLLCRSYRAQLLSHTQGESDHHLPELSRLLPFEIPWGNAPSFPTQTWQRGDSPDTEDRVRTGWGS